MERAEGSNRAQRLPAEQGLVPYKRAGDIPYLRKSHTQRKTDERMDVLHRPLGRALPFGA